MNQQAGKTVIIAGIIVLIVGVIIYFFGNSFKWLGRLPGDVRIVKGNTRIYFPIVTMLIISIILTVIVNIIRKIL